MLTDDMLDLTGNAPPVRLKGESVHAKAALDITAFRAKLSKGQFHMFPETAR
jgi:hypothetical protein